MMPLKPSPNHAETANSPASFWVQQKADHRGDLARRAGQDRLQAADPVGDIAVIART
jgi:hypothetical protein